MTRALIAGLACVLLIAGAARATTDPAALPFLEGWADTGRITVDDDWSGVAGVVDIAATASPPSRARIHAA